MGYEVASKDQRQVWPAIWNGLKCRCPRCGEGKLFARYLKVADRCEACGQDLHHHRADDLPPYIAITIVGHILVFLMLHLDMEYRIEPITYVMVMIPLAVILPLLMLPSIKGGVVGLQWANKMHGFDPSHRDPALPDDIK